MDVSTELADAPTLAGQGSGHISNKSREMYDGSSRECKMSLDREFESQK